MRIVVWRINLRFLINGKIRLKNRDFRENPVYVVRIRC